MENLHNNQILESNDFLESQNAQFNENELPVILNKDFDMVLDAIMTSNDISNDAYPLVDEPDVQLMNSNVNVVQPELFNGDYNIPDTLENYDQMNDVINSISVSNFSDNPYISSPSPYGSVLSPGSSHQIDSPQSDLHQSPRYMPEIVVLWPTTNFDALNIEVGNLESVQKYLPETTEMFDIRSKHTENYSETLRKLQNADNELYILYEALMNDCLIQQKDICVEDQNFIDMKIFLNELLKLILKMHQIAPNDDLKVQTRDLIQKVLTKAFLIVKQPTQIQNVLKNYNASLVLLCYPTISINSVHPVTVELFSERALQHKLRGIITNDLRTFKIKRHSKRNTPAPDYKMTLAVNNELGFFKGDFEQMKIANWERQSNNSTIFDDKYSLVFETAIDLPNQEPLTILTYSKPIIVLTHTNQEHDAQESILWDTACASVGREPFKVTPDLKWSKVKRALNVLCTQILVRGLSEQNLDFLFVKIVKNSDEPFQNVLPDDHDIKRVEHLQCTVKDLNSQGNKKPSMFDWILMAFQLAKIFFSEEWENGLIHGFVSKNDATQMLLQQKSGTFLIRFSETNIGALSIVCVKERNFRPVVDHIFISEAHLKEKSLQETILTASRLENILCIDGTIKNKKDAFIFTPKPIPNGYVGLHWIALAEE